MIARNNVIRRVATLAAFALVALSGAAHVGAQAYPAKPIKLIVGFPPGGGSDTLARITAAALTQRLGQTVVVDNKPGANTILAAQFVATQPADGYTLFFVSASFAINPSLYKLTYDPDKDFSPAALVGFWPLLLITNNDLPANSVKELIALARSKPGALTFASFGVGSAGHLAGELFMSMTGTSMLHVPFKGSAPAITEVLGGRVSIMFPGIGSALALAKSGKLKGIAVTTGKRSAGAPDIPTVAESGLPGFEVASWESVLAPGGTAPDILARLNKAINEIASTAEFREKSIGHGFDADGTRSPPEARQFIRSETAKWTKVVKERNIKVD